MRMNIAMPRIYRRFEKLCFYNLCLILVVVLLVADVLYVYLSLVCISMLATPMYVKALSPGTFDRGALQGRGHANRLKLFFPLRTVSNGIFERGSFFERVCENSLLGVLTAGGSRGEGVRALSPGTSRRFLAETSRLESYTEHPK